jgi:hypothetical protein
MSAEVYVRLHGMGVTVRLEDGRLLASPRAAVTDEAAALIRANRGNLMAHIAEMDEADRMAEDVYDFLMAAPRTPAGPTMLYFRHLNNRWVPSYATAGLFRGAAVAEEVEPGRGDEPHAAE